MFGKSENKEKNKSEIRYWPCLLRRIIDLNPEEKKEVFIPGVTLKSLKSDIYKNINMLLNSKSHPSEEELERWPEIQNSVINYGLPDYCGLINTQDNREKVRERIEFQLKTFEPRLDPESLEVEFVEETDGSKSKITYQIRGNIRVAEIEEEIVFKSFLDLETGMSTVKEE
ncbi:MAG: type VI secretion system baseplate subunit TssE [Alphaproteobacteria bacterium]|nr:type VI secretion system baseplate subunit TssE [Alphaproteobacteria bacterium]